MEIEINDYEQLNKGREFFRYRSLGFEAKGIRLGEELLEYPDNIKEDIRSQEIVRFILASRVIVDTFTLKRYLKRIADEFVPENGVITLLPRKISYHTAGVFVADLIYPLFRENVWITFDVLVNHLNIDRLRVLIKLMEFKSRLVKVIESVVTNNPKRSFNRKALKDKLTGMLLHEIPELKTREKLVSDLMLKEIVNAESQLGEDMFKDPAYPKDAKLLVTEQDNTIPRNKWLEYPTHYSIGDRKTTMIGNFEIVDTECGIPEIYRHFTACPFPDLFTQPGELYIKRCPVNHSFTEEQ